MKREFHLDGRRGSDVSFRACFEGVMKGPNGTFRLKFSTRPTDLARGKLLDDVVKELELSEKMVFVNIQEIG